MVDGNLTGYGQHKFKSINVEANLLDSWIEERKELEQAVKKNIAVFLAVCSFGGIVIPLTWSLKAGISFETREIKREQAEIEKELESLKGKVQAALPHIAFNDRTRAEHDYSATMLRETARIINAAPEGVVFQSLKTEVLSGELTVKVNADAKESRLGREFVNKASKGEQVVDALQTGVRKSTALGKDSVSFDFIKKMGVEK